MASRLGAERGWQFIEGSVESFWVIVIPAAHVLYLFPGAHGGCWLALDVVCLLKVYCRICENKACLKWWLLY